MKRFAATLILAGASLLAEAACESRIRGIEPLIKANLVIVGEVHGTVEAPRLAAELVCRLLNEGNGPVVVLLEISRDEQKALDAYLVSKATPSDRAELLAGPFWRRPMQDGKSSGAMLGLLEFLRVERANGRDLSVLAIDLPRAGVPGVPPSEYMKTRDLMMARHFLENRREGTRYLALIGNWHSRRVKDSFAGNLPDLSFISINVLNRGGSAWICVGKSGKVECAKHSRFEEYSDASLDWSVVLSPSGGHDGVAYGGIATTSPPAVESK